MSRQESKSGKFMLERVKAREIKLDKLRKDSKKKRKKYIDEANTTRKRLGLRLLKKGGLVSRGTKFKGIF
jgi:hypothetical protein